jgi:hypothetical protein
MKASPCTGDISAFFSDVVTLAFWGVVQKKKQRRTKDKNKSPK